MRISINCPVLSVEFNKTTKNNDIEQLHSRMVEYFQSRSYSPDVEEYSFCLICVSAGFDEFFKPKRPKYYVDKTLKTKGLPINEVHLKNTFTCEIKLDYTSFRSSDKENGYNIIATSVLKFLEELKYPTAIKSFDKERFNNDIREFFIQIGCTISNE